MTQQTRSEVGMNKTGIMMSPIDSAEAKEGAIQYTIPPEGDNTLIAENRIRYMKEADTLGSIPLPASVKGMYSSIKERMSTGSNVFLDKLGERIAFERTGFRLYEALLSKYAGTLDKKALPPFEMLEQFYQEELMHFYLVSDVMKEIGGDPTAVTPAADVCAVASMGWVQVMTDPRTTFSQSLEIILQAELVDNAGWEVLIDLALAAGLEEIADQFKVALEEEAYHLENVRNWVSQLCATGESVVDVKRKH